MYKASLSPGNTPMRRTRAGLAGLLLLATSCSDMATPPSAVPPDAPSMNQVSYVSLCCNTILHVGELATFWVTVHETSGNWYSTQNATWTSSNPYVATVGAGQVQAHNPGYAVITATVEGQSASINIDVPAPPVVTTVQISPSSLTVNLNQAETLYARAYDQYGGQMSGQTATWSTGNSAVATVSSSGAVTGVAVGSTTVTATIAGKTASVPVTVQNGIVTGGIYGPGMVLSEGTYTWGLSSVSGGDGTYAYQWEIDWADTPFEGFIPIAGGDSFSKAVTGCEGSFEIRVLVVSGTARTWVNHFVENYASASMCW